MRVGANERIRKGYRLAILLPGDDDGSEILQVHLVNNTRSWRDHPEITEGLLPPAQQGIALAIALIFTLDVACKGQC